MSKSIPLAAFLVCLAVPLAARVSIQSVKPSKVLVRPCTSVTINLPDPRLTITASQLSTPASHSIKSGSDNTSNNDTDKDKDKYQGRDNDDAQASTPEPSTLLSFGAALIIGGGVFFLGRLRKERK